MIRKNIYKWHRTLSLITAVPVLLWAASGFMHPIMTNIRPKVATQVLTPAVIDSSKIKVSLETALKQNHIDSFTNVRIVHIADNWFYQVQQYGKEPVYLATLTGKVLTAGDWIYAQYLGRQFLEGQKKDSNIASPMPTDSPAASANDCCDAATDLVVNNVKGAKIRDASTITSFDSEYKSINRLLPVYRVSFDKADGIRIYVETTQDRFAFAMDNKRRAFDKIFTLIHTWGWLDFMGKGKLIVEFLLVSIAFLTTCMGTYIFFNTKSKKVPGNPVNRARRNHRYTSIVIALFTLMFTFSGAYHAISKLKEDTRGDYFVQPEFYSNQLRFDFNALQAVVKMPISNVSLVKIRDNSYWRITIKQTGANKRKDLMKDAVSPMPKSFFVHAGNLTILKDGETDYARFLASTFSGRNEKDILSVEPVTKFSGEYNFTDKRLPVWKISYKSGGDERYFVESATGRLSKKLTNAEQAQDYSFAFFHKHEFLSWAGKGWKDFSTMFWAMAQIAMVVIGLTFYFKLKKNRN